MDGETLENIVKIGGAFIGLSVAGLGVMIGAFYTGLKIIDRMDALKPLQEAYRNGKLDRKPNLLNVYSFYEPTNKIGVLGKIRRRGGN